MRELNVTAPALVLEPVGRNTAPALTLAALAALDGGGDPVLAVTPADQTVTDAAAFAAAMRRAVTLAAAGAIVTLGIVPHAPETGYGYIQAASTSGESQVLGFVEKPDLADGRALPARRHTCGMAASSCSRRPYGWPRSSASAATSPLPRARRGRVARVTPVSCARRARRSRLCHPNRSTMP